MCIFYKIFERVCKYLLSKELNSCENSLDVQYNSSCIISQKHTFILATFMRVRCIRMSNPAPLDLFSLELEKSAVLFSRGMER